MPHYLLRSRTLFRLLHFPKYLILVRDIRDVFVAHYEKWKGEYDVDFSTYLRSDVGDKMYKRNIWFRIRFLNGCGPVVERHPERTAVLKYEDLKADTHGRLAWVCDYFNIKDVTPDLLDEVIAAASKEEMTKRLTGPELKVVRMDSRPADEWYSDEDRRFVAEVCRRIRLTGQADRLVFSTAASGTGPGKGQSSHPGWAAAQAHGSGPKPRAHSHPCSGCMSTIQMQADSTPKFYSPPP